MIPLTLSALVFGGPDVAAVEGDRMIGRNVQIRLVGIRISCSREATFGHDDHSPFGVTLAFSRM